MRNTVDGLVRVRAVAGTHVVFLAFDMRPADANGLLGFSIQREDLIEQERIWLRGNKTFASLRPAEGFEEASSREHPFQAFQWADYSAKPGYRYRYRVVPRFGTPAALTEGAATEVEIGTEPLSGGEHDVHFNRGAIASQAFARRFPGLSLDDAGAPAYAWLARDLLPAMLAFIGRAQGASWSLRAAIYELRWPRVLQAFLAASQSGADVRIVYHAKDDDTGAANEVEIDAAGIRGLCTPRSDVKLMHNKFIVLLRDNAPVAVWTGSTNLSRNALHGQLNVGHVIRRPDVAGRFLAYWNELAGDPTSGQLKDWVEANNPLPPADETGSVVTIFSPHRGREVLDWWVELANDGAAPRPLFMTFPFGISKDFRPPFDRNDGVLRFALLDKYVNGGTTASRAAAIAEIRAIRTHPNVGMALGERIFIDWVDGWHRESAPIGVNVNWVHTKFMLIDPLGPNPVTLSGSANFSEASVNANDENMVLVRGDTRVADIYFGEFMRIFAHHRFRESVARHIEKHGSAAFNTWKPQDLFETSAEWLPRHFVPNSEADIKRRYFAGP
jgi:phosphatidylserine/phosphatidylglycerophosphate/cardiolipin synthase-like enzyme